MNKPIYSIAIVAALGSLILAGCTNSPTGKPAKEEPKSASATPDGPDAKIQAALAKLSPADRKLAEAQKWCAVQTKNRLGTMDTPIKVMINDQPVFLCCESCEDRAKANPDKTLAKVAELKKAAAEGK